MDRCIHDRQPFSCSACHPESVFRIYQRVARKRGLRFDITLQQFIELVTRHVCAYCGEGFEPLGLDRKDPALPYTLTNVVPACKTCNKMKSDGDKNIFLAQVIKIARYQDTLKKKKLPTPPPIDQGWDTPGAVCNLDGSIPENPIW